MRPTEVPELQVELEEFCRTSRGADFCRKFSSIGRRHLDANKIASCVREAPSYWVSDQMCELAQHAARTMPPQPTLPTDLPSPSGFCLFEKPVQVDKADGKDSYNSIRGFAWELAHFTLRGLPGEWPGVKWWYLSDAFDHGGHWFSYRDTTLLPVLETGDPFKTNNVEFDAEMAAMLEEAENLHLGPEAVAFRRLPHALWALMGQRIATVTDERPERATRRRLEKAGHPKQTSTIRIVVLRRLKPEEQGAGGERKDWKHSWIVSAHWRNQYLPSTKSHRLQWITPYVKGDGPLVIKETVNVLKR